MTNKYVRIDNFLHWDGDELVMKDFYHWAMAPLINMVGIIMEELTDSYEVSFPYFHDKRWWFYKADTKPATQEEYEQCLTYIIERALQRE